MPTLFDNSDSGNGYKARLLMALLGQACDVVEVDIFNGDSRTPEFLAMNPIGRIPTLRLDDGTCLAESGAILFFLAEGTAFWPADRLQRAEVLKWMFFEQYSHEPYIAVLRSWTRHGPMTEARRSQWAEREQKGYDALDVMEQHLAGRDWFVTDGPTIADIALYAYSHVATDGGFDLSDYRAIRAWLDRVAGLPGYIPLA